MKHRLLKTMWLLFGLLPFLSQAAETLPYHHSCKTFDGLTTEIGNSLGSRAWTRDSGNSCLMLSSRQSGQTHDGYLWLPAINFEYESCYRFSVDVRSLYTTMDGAFELIISDSPSIANGNHQVLRPKTTLSNLPVTFDAYYSPDLTGEKYLGIHVNGPSSAGAFYVMGLDVTQCNKTIPAAPTDLTVTSPTKGVKKVDISFNVVNKNVAGGRLSSITKANIYCDKELIHTIESPRGAQNYTLSGGSIGRHVFSVRCESANGEGEIANTVGRVGGIIEAPEYDYNGWGITWKVPVVYTPDGNVTASWKRRTDNSNVKYNVYRMPENLKVVDMGSDTVFTEKALSSEDPIAYWYRVEAVYPDSIDKVGNSMIMSLHNQVPWKSRFTEDASLYEYSIYDVDGKSGWWTYASQRVGVTNTDDWLVTPGIILEGGKYYRLDVETNVYSSPACYSVSMGRTNLWSNLDTELLENYRVTDQNSDIRTKFFRAPESGEYFFGVHAHDPKEPDNVNSLRLLNMSITEVDGSLPDKVENISVSYSKTNLKDATISVTAPSKTIDGNTLTSLTKIELYKDGQLISENTTVTPGQVVQFPATITPGEKALFKAIACNAAGSSDEVTLSQLVYEPAYTQPFGSEDVLNDYTIIDGFIDNYSWHWFNYQARSYPSTKNGADEWLITPAMRLEAGKFYKVSTVATNASAKELPHIMKVALGKAPTAEAMTQEVIPEYAVTGVGYDQRVLLKNYITVPETGEYYLGVHDFAEKGYYTSELLIDDLTISSKINGEVPDTITNFSINPNKSGALDGTVTFKMPTKALNGTLLQANTALDLVLYNNGVAFAQLQKLPGESVTVPITVTEENIYLITVICGNSYGRGREAENIAFFGINRAGNPVNVKAQENPEKFGEVTVSWEHNPLDYDGFPMNPDHLTYEVINLTGDEESIIKSGIVGNSYTFQARNNDQDQSFMRFAVRARTRGGGSMGVYVPYISVGQPYTLPLKESFANYNPKMTMIQQTPEDGGYAMWGFNSEDPNGNGSYDNDNGIALMEVMFIGGKQRLITGKIDLRKAKKPVLALRLLHPKSVNRPAQNLFEVQISTTTTGLDAWETVEGHTVQEWAEGEYGWQRIEVDLSKYVGNIVYMGFVATAYSHTFTCFDAFEMDEAKDKNLGSISLSYPDEVYPGTEQKFNFRIKNHGHAAAENYTVNLYRNGSLRKTLEGVKLQPGEKHNYEFVDVVHHGENTRNYYYGLIEYEGDQDTYDNKSKVVTIRLNDSPFPTVSDVKGVQDTPGSIRLDWNAPVVPDKPSQITDDFENYESWSTMSTGGFGRYTLYDMDDCGVVGIKNVTLPNVGLNSKQSWFIMDDTLSPLDEIENAKSHSGHKYLACLALYDPENGSADDWIVSPELTGEAQTISFWARSFSPSYLERFEILATSLNDKSLDALCREENSIDIVYNVPAEWTKYSFNLPAGTKYFAIRHRAYGDFMLFVDDLTYTPVGNERLTLTGYNIYRNGKIVNEQPITPTTFNHQPPASGDHTYGISALYNLGESPLQEVAISYTGVNGITNDNIRIESHHGRIVIYGAAELEIQIASADGKTLYAGKADSNVLSVNAVPGVYAVSIAGKPVKIIVK